MVKKLKQRILLSPPHLSGEEYNYVKEAFDSNWVAPAGPHLQRFEDDIASYVGSSGAVALQSGTSAIHLALKTLKVGEGDRVFCSTFTFAASANPIRYLGAEPVFIDSEPDTWNMSPQALARAFSASMTAGELPKAVIVVHLYGQPAKMDEIMAVCDAYHVPVIEDAAESLGSKYLNRHTGTFGKIGIFSFNGNKIITTSGGGMLVSDDPELLDETLYLATQAKQPALHYQHNEIGYNYRLSNVLAGIGRAQVKVLDERVNIRRAIHRTYAEAFADVPGISFMPEYQGSYASRWLTALVMESSDTPTSPERAVRYLAERQIEARPLWKPLHLQPVFADSLYYPHSPNVHVAERLFDKGLCLPSGSSLTIDEQTHVINCLKAYLKEESAREVI
ncbi:aminotransferase class I/II-fold pyridoxal phosphate-dependent enzyme [Salisediminibacterium halotolerans]|uniref:Pyridoxal phosphate-dependent aminotransferase EpsN n=1 Tax=Salisediminibacterium halotolerans TaxID=517425 RepID=A0A1H9VYC9_9BACI|nr:MULTISPECIES: aminotransferase class I/II-fold pyridoxal phosphate-dependent enzyme [Salisediminibacterium]RLJ73175.1 pyridoxal phosphate-dependent aminotransferase EpsN [Actinophytocola xinjiangensis]RPE86597.1 pyridoxal phosphate-dependent aminotransferase EpsN [Salisediminibacterium halotolerans]TWG33972.1 pyridoxal phosphate-dependent aminotransferase EpsN [Salisediminibacterium halotolerans]SES26397.1 pyridoxal phosphate-dependent aminotransferase EpsN [Salisediminibacterium haloalkalit